MVLALIIGCLIITFFAFAKVITKAGYSYRWIYLPLTPLCLWIVSFILLAVDVRNVNFDGTTVATPVSLGNFFVLQALDFLSLFVTWVFFIVFAFSSWPASVARGGNPMPPSQGSPGAGPPIRPSIQWSPPVPVGAVAASPGGPGPAPAPPSGAAPAFAPAPGTTTGAAEVAATVIYCSWCGKERAVNAPAIHYCGSMERPAAFCMSCGTPLEGGAPGCANCGTPATKLSR